MTVSLHELALNLVLRIRRSSFIRPSSLVLIFQRTIQLVSVVLGNHLTRKFGRTGVGNEQTAILGTTALRSIQGLSKSSLEQSRLRTQSRDQSCKRALVQGLKALSTGSGVQTLECSTEFFAVLSLGNRS